MGNLKSYSGKELLVILESLGFEVIRVKGSHHYLKHQDGRATVIPLHSNETIGIGLFMKILKDIEMTKKEFINLFQKFQATISGSIVAGSTYVIDIGDLTMKTFKNIVLFKTDYCQFSISEGISLLSG